MNAFLYCVMLFCEEVSFPVIAAVYSIDRQNFGHFLPPLVQIVN